MAAIMRYFQVPNNITSGTWNWGDVAYGFRSGLLLNQAPENLIQYNNSSRRYPLPLFVLASYSIIPEETLGKVTRLARSENWIANHRQIFALGAYALLGANAYAVVTKIYTRKFSEARTPFQKFLTAIWRMTPYLALLTNIALTILELRVNRMKAIVGLTVTAVTLLQPYVLSRAFARFLNPGIRLPMDLVALYYGSNKNRFTIVLGWTQFPILRDPINAGLTSLLESLFKYFWKG